MQVQPSFRAQLITRRTYCRPKDDEGLEFETWDEVIDRVIQHQRWLWKRAVGRPLNKGQENELEELRQLMLDRKAVVAGRTLWLGGTEIARRRESSMFNPGRRNTRFITDQGVKSFEDFEDGDTTTVLTHEGNWKQARVICAGIQPINRITFSRGSSKQVEHFTPNHTWILANRERTDALKVGDRICKPPSLFERWNYDDASPLERLWWCYGFVYGDGATVKDSKGEARWSHVRLCADKARFLNRFVEMGFEHSFPPSCNKDPMVYTGRYLKTLPSKGYNVEMQRAFIRGYLDADGAKNPNFHRNGHNEFRSIQATGLEACNYIEQTFPMVGLYITSIKDVPSDTNFGPRSDVTKVYRFTADFGDSNNSDYVVSEIERLGDEEVWCLTVEDDHSFVLPNGVVTGNCSHTRVHTVHDVVDVLWLLLQGCGVGFTASSGSLNGFHKPIQNIEVIRSTRSEKGGREHNIETWDAETGTWTISVGDSAEAWAKSVGKLLAGKYPAQTLVLDFSEIRAAGTRLKGYGWISQGDQTISTAFQAIVKILNRRSGQLLRKMDIHDICNWLGTILSTRRSAQISLMEYGDPEWREFATCKKNLYQTGNYHREQSNNSLMFNQRPTKSQLAEIFQLMLDSGGSEPGFINAAEARRRAPWFAGVNPCLTGDTLVATGNGLSRIEDLAGGNHHVRDGNGNLTLAKFAKTGSDQELLRVELSDGSIYRCTPYHLWVKADGLKVQAVDLKAGEQLKIANIEGLFGSIHKPVEAYLDAWLMADGTWYNNEKSSKLYVYWPKYQHIEQLEAAGCSFGKEDGQRRRTALFAGRPLPDKTKVPGYVLSGDRETVKAFIEGYTQSDGHVGLTSKGWMVQYSSIHRGMLQELQALLRLFGVKSKVSLGNPAGKRSMPNHKGGTVEYDCKDCWRLTVSNPSRFFEVFDPEKNKRGPYKIEDQISVVSVSPLVEKEDVYCCGVPTTSSFDLPTVHTGNCGEILLPDKGFCNLVSIDLARFKDDNSGLHRAIYLMARANYRQTCVNLDDGILQRSWHENNEFLRLCGVSLMGQVRRGDLGPYEKKVLKSVAVAGAYSMADELGTPKPKNVTTGKPDGTVAKICDTTEGIHKPLGKYIINTVAFSGFDPLIPMLRQHGYVVTDHPVRPGDVLVQLPVMWDDVEFDTKGSIDVNLESAVSQLDRYREMMLNYIEQNQSVTISYSPEEVPEIVDWIYEHWDDYVGVSFLLRADPTKTAEELGYPYLPQAVVTREVYDTATATLQPFEIDGGDMVEIEDCAGGACPIR